MSKKVAKKENNLPSTEMAGSWGAEGAHATDMLIPKLLLMQGQSGAVSATKAAVGDIIKSTNEEILAPRGERLAFIPLMTDKSWRISEYDGSRFAFRRNEPWTIENDRRELEWEENDVKWRADRCLNFYVMLPTEIDRDEETRAMIEKGEMPEKANMLLPCLLQFTRTSYNPGKYLISHFKKAVDFRRPPAAWWFWLGSDQQTKDRNNYFIYTVEDGGLTKEEHLVKSYQWYQIIKSSTVEVHEEEVAGDPVPVDIPEEESKF